MKEQFVPYEIAIKLKEKGFIDECMAYYEISLTAQENEEDGFSGPFGWKKGEVNFNKGYFVNNSLFDFSNENWLMCAAPLWQQVIDWLSNTHNIEVDALRYTYSGGVYKGKCYMWYVDQYDPKYNHELEEDDSHWILNERKSQGFDFKSKQEAIQAGIIEALTLI